MEIVWLFVAGFAGGIVNSIAGGGSFITFPALMLAGLPPIIANATNTFASCIGYLSGMVAFKQQLASQRHILLNIALLSLLGGALGAVLLVFTPQTTFRSAIPWLLLLATVFFIWGDRLHHWSQQTPLRQKMPRGSHLLGPLLLFLVAFYGGFFNAGLGIMLLSYFALMGMRDINVMNALKLYVSAVLSAMAIVVFTYRGVIDWVPGTVVMIGNMLGGYLAAKVSLGLSQRFLKRLVITIAVVTTGYFFIDVYLR
ncbi:MAG TPA: sulfite exporter TauE/SafE family protein [Pseudomonadales bacterium]|nr:sulfite exporter TauE/SafE family protein [Pseudomonadales bacterium]